MIKSGNKKTSDQQKTSFQLGGTSLDFRLCLYLTFLLAFGTRLYKIGEPDHVCWDETHFGKMGSYYINHTFFFDVHPPLGKMLIGLSGKLTGYNGTFAFNKPGDKYGDHNYLGMRLFCVTLGALIIPFTYVIVWELTGSLSASLLASALITFDIGLLTLSQYILLDPILLFFVIGSFMGSVKLGSYYDRSFTFYWWFWLIWTGTFLACAMSVKFVGLFVVILVGLRTVAELWQLLGDCNLPMKVIGAHFIARVLCLILLPIFIYTTFFWIHLSVLYKSGPGDGFYSSAFQSQLEGNSLYNISMPRHVAFGAVITLKNHRTGGGYLHSHWHLYPEGVGARQQQVTAYSHKDENNKWVIKKYDKEPNAEKDEIELVKNGDLVRLEHQVTARNLHSHRERGPVTKKHYQVTCYGENGVGDANDVWRVEIISAKPDERLATVTSKFRLIHYFVGCALHSHSKQLPKWGYEQMEVTCSPNTLDKNGIWNIEDNFFPRLPNVSFQEYAPSFIEKFIESHAVMLQGNAGLKPKEGEVTSRPWQWPINYRGQFFSGNEYKIYLLGNPIIWWANIAIMAVYLILQISILIREQRGCNEVADIKDQNSRLTYASVWLLIGWGLHYFPFFAMGRVLYFHHYFPALIFSSMLSAVVIDYLLRNIPKLIWPQLAETIFHFGYGVIISSIVYSFYLFSPLSYGTKMESGAESNHTLTELRWLESWEF
ncbi:protein O-mannosyl-transferase 2 [Tetranychus urticae]|uniref:Protein O-mannosyl-transferase 2 n=1 Tax=Tetranychus urticae TaxID=32264 RepID=T1KER1_TETUR|nr:protein O-mannosyl-transferase 2 [Tetranychus urticae]XP_025016928.1 protein O-mannosyl-transferase 2 [Tetranychus urticae]